MKSALNLKKTAAAVSALLLAFGSFSCQDKALEPTSQIQFSDQVVFSNPTRIGLQVNGLYSYVKSGTFLGGRVQVFGDIRANDFTNRSSNLVTGTAVWNHTLTETSQNDVVNTWGAGYSAINQINVFLAGMDANAASFVAPTFPTNFTTTTALAYQGEARFLRALCYYTLLQFYARPYIESNGTRPGLPLRLKAEVGSEGNDLARSTVAEVYAQIITDLNFAEQNLPLTYGATAFNNITRAHRNTAIALKTRVYLAMGRYADVITEANKIVPTSAPFVASSGVAHALNPSVTGVFAVPQETAESILSFPFTAQDTPGTQNQLAFYYLPASLGGSGGEYSLNTGTGGILSDPGFGAADARRTSLTARSGTEVFLTKYPTGSPYTDKAPVIRYAEVLLSLAEARVRSTNSVDAQALALLNAVRGRSNPTGVYTAASFTSASAMANAILLERRIEFLGEGLRNTDLLRLDATIPGKGTIGPVEPNNVLYVWPIPSTELLTNSLIVRN